MKAELSKEDYKILGIALLSIIGLIIFLTFSSVQHITLVCSPKTNTCFKKQDYMFNRSERKVLPIKFDKIEDVIVKNSIRHTSSHGHRNAHTYYEIYLVSGNERVFLVSYGNRDMTYSLAENLKYMIQNNKKLNKEFVFELK